MIEKLKQQGYVNVIYVQVNNEWQKAAYSKFERITNNMLLNVEEQYFGATDSAYLDINIPFDQAIEILNKRG